MGAISSVALHSFQAAGMENNNLVYEAGISVYPALFPPWPNLNALLGVIPYKYQVAGTPLQELPSQA